MSNKQQGFVVNGLFFKIAIVEKNGDFIKVLKSGTSQGDFAHELMGDATKENQTRIFQIDGGGQFTVEQWQITRFGEDLENVTGQSKIIDHEYSNNYVWWWIGKYNTKIPKTQRSYNAILCYNTISGKYGELRQEGSNVSDKFLSGVTYKVGTVGNVSTHYVEFSDTGAQSWFAHLTEKTIFPGDESEIGGGTGTLDNSSDNIEFPGDPALSATDAGFITLYKPTQTQMRDLSSYMWSDSFNLDQFKKIFADPMDVIIGLNILPVDVPSSGTKNIKIGLIDTGVSMNLASSQYVTVDCGPISVKEYWGSALDYSPYTKISIYLPYIGTRELKTDDVMNKTVQVKYNVDILSGSCTALIKCGGSVLYEFSGSCGCPIPLTSINWTNTVTAAIQLASAGIGVAAGAAGAAAGAAGLTAVQGANLVSSTAGSVMSAKPNIQRSGAVSGSAGMLGIQVPYLIIERPRQSLAGDYNKYVGYPSNITAKLSDLSGYTEVESIHFDGFNATDAEIKEMYNLLREGVIL